MRRSLWAGIAGLVLLPGLAAGVPVSLTHTSLPMSVPQVPGGHHVGCCAAMLDDGVYSFTFDIELDALGGTLANTSIRQSYGGGAFGGFAATATRNGKVIATQPGDEPDWFRDNRFAESLSCGPLWAPVGRGSILTCRG